MNSKKRQAYTCGAKKSSQLGSKLLGNASLISFFGAATSALIFNSSAMAQDEGEVANAGAIDRIVVTAERREEQELTVPVATTVLDGDYIDRARINTLGDVVTRAPNVSFFAENRNSTAPAIRGAITQDDSAGSDQPVAIFIDGIYQGRLGDFQPDFFDIERIEILRGPQGTLFGRNVTGGAINVITKKPKEDAEAFVEVTGGKYSRVDVKGYANGKIAENVYAKVAGSARFSDGYTESTQGFEDLNEEDIISVRSQLLYKPNEGLDILIGGDFTRDRSFGLARDIFGDQPSVIALSDDPRVSDQDLPGENDFENWGLLSNFNLAVGEGNITSITGYRSSSSKYDFDFDATPVDAAHSRQEVVIDQITQELRYASPVGGRLDFQTGVYYLWSEHTRREGFHINPAPGTVIALLQAGVTNTLIEQQIKTSSIGIFGQGTFHLSDQLGLTFGGRWTHEKKSGYLDKSGDDSFIFTPEGAFRQDVSESWSAFTPKVALEFEPTDDLFFYASWSRGFKSGGFSSAANNPAEAQVSFDPEFADSYEGGVKTYLFDDHLRLNLAVFHVDYKDLQVLQLATDEGVGVNFVVANAGKASNTGVELDAQARLAQGFDVFGSYGFQDGKYDSFMTADGDFSGNRLALAPKHSLHVGASYSTDLSNGGSITIAGDYQYKSDISFFPDNSATELVDDSTQFDALVDARLFYEDPSGHWRLTFWGKNLTDETVVLNAANSTAVFNLTFAELVGGLNNVGVEYNPPRTYGVTLTFHN